MTENVLVAQLRQAKAKWMDLYDSLPDQVPASQGTVSKAAITSWFDFNIAGLDRFFRQEEMDAGIVSVYLPSIMSSVANIEGHMLNAVSNGPNWLAQTTQTLMSLLWTIRSSLPWLLRDGGGEADLAKFPRIQEIITQANAIEALFAKATGYEDQINRSVANAKSQEAALQDQIEKINVSERQAKTAETNATASSVAAKAEKEKVDQYVSTLSEAIEAQKKLFAEFEAKRESIDATLEGASKVAMARSFQERRKSLDETQKRWRNIFIVGIGGLSIIGALLGGQFLVTMQSAEGVPNDTLGLALLFVRFLVLGPVVWLTWFAARQYGHVLRLAEDYAFKEAAAHAFVGYRTEMGEDAEMLRLLREYAIENFGANPVRTLSKNEPVTPLNEVLDKTLGKVSPDKLAEILSTLLKKEPK